jgi:MFS family permease
MGVVFSAFAWTYGLFEVPFGWLGDKIGARKILMRIVVCWSFFTAATGWAWNQASLVVTRALFGAGEAGCFPNITKTFTTWLPAAERVRAQGILWLSARWGGAFTPLLVLFVLQFVSWRWSFVIFGAVGVVWAVAFYRWYRDDPRQHPGLNAAERALVPADTGPAHGTVKVPWRRILSAPRVWLLCLQYFFLAYGFFFYVSWYPDYVKTRLGVQGAAAAVIDGTPLFFMGLGSLFCGFFLARLTAWTGSSARARRLMAFAGFLGATLFLLVSIRIHHPFWAAVVLGLAGFSNDLVMPPSWGACMDIGRRYSGSLSATMNMVGCAGGGLSPLAIGYLLEWTGQNWDAVFYMSAAAYFLGFLCWIFLDPVTPIDSDPEEVTA